MYNDDNYGGRRESRPLSYIGSPLSDSMEQASGMDNSDPARGSPKSPAVRESMNRTISNEKASPRPNGIMRPNGVRMNSFERESGPLSPTLASMHERTTSDTANSSFPLNDIDYESDPAAVALELSNLQALRRMSMDVTATGDPDLPAFKSNSFAIAPSASADEDDTSRLFWVPARLHPELAPKEFKSFLESKADQIKRRSGELSSFSGEGSAEQQGSGSGLRRKKSMLSKQIDNSNGRGAEGYTDGAEVLERKRSLTQRGRSDSLKPNLHELENLVKDPSKIQQRFSLETAQGALGGEVPASEDMPILPAAPPGHSLRRSTRTTYRRGSLKKGERVPFSKRAAKQAAETDTEESPVSSPVTGPNDFIGAGLSRVQTDPSPAGHGKNLNFSRAAHGTAVAPGTSPSTTFDGILQRPDGGNTSSAPVQQRHWQSRISSNGRSSLIIPPSDQMVPQIIETPPPPPTEEPKSAPPVSLAKPGHLPERISSHDPPPSQPPQVPLPQEPIGGRVSKRPGLVKQPPSRGAAQTLNDMAAHPSPLPGNSTRTDSLSFIPTLTEDKKADNKKPKDKKDADSRKSSWGWLLGNEEKEKEKEKEKKREEEMKKNRKTLTKPVDKVHDNTRLDVLQTSIDGGRGRESIVLDRDQIKLDEERKKESVRKSSGGDSKKEKDGLFSSFFGGGKKKSSENVGKKHSSRTLSPDPPHKELKPDIDYNWTRFSILEERAIYRMAHIKLANPRRALYSQVLLSNFMYSYLAKVQQMHPQMQLPSSAAQKQQKKDQPEEYSQNQKWEVSLDIHKSRTCHECSPEMQKQQQKVQQDQQTQHHQQHNGGSSYTNDSPHMYDYDRDDRDDPNRPQSRRSKLGMENGNGYGGHIHEQYYQQGNHNPFSGQEEDDDDDDMW